MHKISVDDIIIDVVRKDIKHLHLSVHPPDGRVRISAPKSIDDEALRSFAAYMDQFLPNWKSLKEELNRFPISHGDWGD